MNRFRKAWSVMLGAALLLSAPEYQQPHGAEIRGDPADFQDPHDPLFRNHGLNLFQRQFFHPVFMTERRWHSSVDECQRRKFF